LAGNNSIIPPYSPEPSDFHVFLYLKTFLGGWWFHNDKKVKEAINTWSALHAASFYNAGIQKLVPRYKCLYNCENYV
jgi:hypothetical protein